MSLSKILGQLNVFAQCRRYQLPLWQCPSFLFLVMGIVIIASSLTAYFVGARYIASPEQVALLVLGLTAVLLVMAFTITQGFERLAQANRMKTEFISVVSHQLRTPLSNLNWSIELLMSGRLGKVEEKQTEYFRILKENIGRMGELVSDLLTVSRIETGTLLFKRESFSLAETVAKLVAELTPFAKASNVEIEFDKVRPLPPVLGDSSQTRLVVENLLDNAVRYIKGGGKIKISLAEKQDSVYFEIKDSGVGIPKDDHKYIFQKFFRSENALKRQTQGSGLGLYIAKSIVERSGGRIGFESQEGRGSTFWFTLPTK